MSPTTVRCVLGMLGTDAHTKGIRTLSRVFRDAGIEVVYLGEHNTYEQFAASVAAEDADLAGVSFSTAGYVKHVAALMRAMDAAGVADVPVLVGGLIHADDEPALRELGVAGTFGPGSTTESILELVFSTADATSAQPTPPAPPAAIPSAQPTPPAPPAAIPHGRNRVH